MPFILVHFYPCPFNYLQRDCSVTISVSICRALFSISQCFLGRPSHFCQARHFSVSTSYIILIRASLLFFFFPGLFLDSALHQAYLQHRHNLPSLVLAPFLSKPKPSTAPTKPRPSFFASAVLLPCPAFRPLQPCWNFPSSLSLCYQL